ncbi:hypothetical protein ACFL26_00745 [Patescibacteria group bacterium]
MRLKHIFLAAVFALAVTGCTRADQNGQTTPPAAPEQQPEEQPAPPEEEGERIRLSYGYPEGWSARNVPEQNRVVFEHDESGAIIAFTVWPLEYGTPEELMTSIRTRIVNNTRGDENTHVNPLLDTTRDGVTAYFFTANRTEGDGTRLTYLWAAFESNLPEFGILMTGTWISIMDSEMFDAFTAIAGSIRFTEVESAETEPMDGLTPGTAGLLADEAPEPLGIYRPSYGDLVDQ